MPELHLKQLRFTYSACRQFTKNKERIHIFNKTGDANYIYKNELDNVCFKHGMAYGDFKDLAKRTASDKVLRYKALNVAKNAKCNGYQRDLASAVYKFFDKKSPGSCVNMQAKPVRRTYVNNEQLSEELNKLIIRKFKKQQFIQDLKIIFGVLI